MFNKKRYFIILEVLALFFFFLSFAFAVEKEVLEEPSVAAEITGEIEEAPILSSPEQPPVAAEIISEEIEEAPPAPTERGEGTIEEPEVEKEPPLIKDDKIIELGAFGVSLPELIEKEKNGPSGYSVLLGYKAVRLGDLSVCNQAKYKSKCKDVMEVLNIRRIAENECGLIKESSFKRICQRVNKGNCTGLSDWKKDMCEGLLNRDITLITQVVKSSGYRKSLSVRYEPDEEPADTACEILACFSGFRDGKDTCEFMLQNISKPDLSDYFLCDIIFGKGDVDKILDGCMADLVFLQHAKLVKDKKICNFINNRYLKGKCLAIEK